MNAEEAHQFVVDIQTGCMKMGYGSPEKPWPPMGAVAVISYKPELAKMIEDE